MIENIECNKNRINAIVNEFNFQEIEDEWLKNEINKALTECKTTERESILLSIYDWFYKQYKEFKKRNLRYIKFHYVDDDNKYTKFYNLIRPLADKIKPEGLGLNNLQNILWQAIDIAINQLQIDYKCTLRGEIDLFWYEKIENYYSFNSDNIYDRVDELIVLKGLLDGIEDYYIKAIITKYYFNGINDEPESNEEDPEYFISRVSEQTLEIPLEKAIDETIDELIGLVSDIMKQLGKIIINKFTVSELITILDIDEDYIQEFSKWYDNL